MQDKLEALKRMVENSRRIVFFGGAGVSTESGIPDFRSTDGLYNQSYRYPPETILSRTFFDNNLEEFYRFYRDKLLVSGVQPSGAHRALAKLEQIGKLGAVITQNIDGLHQAAGSKAVYELHGSVKRNYCMKCRGFYSDEDIGKMPLVPICRCGGVIKPDVVLYEEGLDERLISKSIEAIGSCDALIVGGTSLTVYPAAGLLRYFAGDNLIIINKTETPISHIASLPVYGSIGQALEYAVSHL